MCGITAIITLDNSQEISSYDYKLRLEREITQSLDKINHRGPDARGSWISNGNRVGKDKFYYLVLSLQPCFCNLTSSNTC